jgi:hypothetical protein
MIAQAFDDIAAFEDTPAPLIFADEALIRHYAAADSATLR